MKITSTMALAAIAATCSVGAVSAKTSEHSDSVMADGLNQHFKGTAVKAAVTTKLQDITKDMNVDGIDLHEVYANSVNGRGNTQASGANVSNVKGSWCHSRYEQHDNHHKHHW